MTLIFIAMAALCAWRITAQQSGNYGTRPEPQPIKIETSAQRSIREPHNIHSKHG